MQTFTSCSEWIGWANNHAQMQHASILEGNQVDGSHMPGKLFCLQRHFEGFLSYTENEVWDRAMAHLVKCLLYKTRGSEFESSNLQHSHKKTGQRLCMFECVHMCVHVSVWSHSAESLGYADGQPGSMFSKRPCLKGIKWRVIKGRHTISSSDF